jgi:hypothetical protein
MLATILVRYVLPVVCVIALFFGMFELGSTHGYNDGYTKAWNTQQEAINKMVDANNAEVEANNNKLEDFEQQAQAAKADAASATFAAMTTRQTVITKYRTNNVKVAASCGWSLPTVQAINSIISAGQPASAPVGASQ